MKSIVALVGMKHRNSEALVASLRDNSPLALAREPNNQYDPNAIQVWSGETHVGYVKAAQARPLARFMDGRGGLMPGLLRVTSDRWPMIEIDLPDEAVATHARR